MKPLFPLEPVGGEGLLPTGKHGGRDSIRSKVFEEDGGGLEGEGETFSRKFPLPPPIFSLPPPSELPLVAHPDGDALAVEIFEKRDDVLAGKAAGKLLEPGGIEIVM